MQRLKYPPFPLDVRVRIAIDICGRTNAPKVEGVIILDQLGGFYRFFWMEDGYENTIALTFDDAPKLPIEICATGELWNPYISSN